jgi:hypothetical protein
LTQLTAVEDTLARTIQMDRHETHSCVRGSAASLGDEAIGAIVDDDPAITIVDDDPAIMSEMDTLFD